MAAFAPRWVTRLAARYNASGPAALGDRRRRNGEAAGLLTPDLLAALAERVRTPPEDGGLWSGPKAAAWIAAHLGLAKVHAQRGWEALKRIGWSIQAPRPRHPRSAGPEQREALKKTWTRRAGHFGPWVDEPIVNRHFPTLADLEAVIAERCRRLEAAVLKPHTDFHWWPRPATPN